MFLPELVHNPAKYVLIHATHYPAWTDTRLNGISWIRTPVFLIIVWSFQPIEDDRQCDLYNTHWGSNVWCQITRFRVMRTYTMLGLEVSNYLIYTSPGITYLFPAMNDLYKTKCLQETHCFSELVLQKSWRLYITLYFGLIYIIIYIKSMLIILNWVIILPRNSRVHFFIFCWFHMASLHRFSVGKCQTVYSSVHPSTLAYVIANIY